VRPWPQEAYDAGSTCFVCGHAHGDGLGLKTFRCDENLGVVRSVATVPEKYEVEGLLRTSTRPTLKLHLLLRALLCAFTLKVRHASILGECFFTMILLRGAPGNHLHGYP